MDPTDAAHVMQTPEEYADFLSGMSFDKRIEMINSFRCAELQGAEELRVLSETTRRPGPGQEVRAPRGRRGEARRLLRRDHAAPRAWSRSIRPTSPTTSRSAAA